MRFVHRSRGRSPLLSRSIKSPKRRENVESRENAERMAIVDRKVTPRRNRNPPSEFINVDGTTVTSKPIRAEGATVPRDEYIFHGGSNSKIGNTVFGFGTLPGAATEYRPGNIRYGIKSTVPAEEERYPIPMVGTCDPAHCADCEWPCYARKSALAHWNHQTALYSNTALVRAEKFEEMGRFFDSVVDLGRYKGVRINTDGDFDNNPEYLMATIRVAERAYLANSANPVRFWAFTKCYDLLNAMQSDPRVMPHHEHERPMPLSDYIQTYAPNYTLMISSWPGHEEDPEYKSLCYIFPVADYLPSLGADGIDWDHVCGGDCGRCFGCATVHYGTGKSNPSGHILFPDHDDAMERRIELADDLWKQVGYGPKPVAWYDRLSGTKILQDYLIRDATYEDMVAVAEQVAEGFNAANRVWEAVRAKGEPSAKWYTEMCKTSRVGAYLSGKMSYKDLLKVGRKVASDPEMAVQKKTGKRGAKE